MIKQTAIDWLIERLTNLNPIQIITTKNKYYEKN